jgi:hypothetical protein
MTGGRKRDRLLCRVHNADCAVREGRRPSLSPFAPRAWSRRRAVRRRGCGARWRGRQRTRRTLRRSQKPGDRGTLFAGLRNQRPRLANLATQLLQFSRRHPSASTAGRAQRVCAIGAFMATAARSPDFPEVQFEACRPKATPASCLIFGGKKKLARGFEPRTC